MLLRPFLELYFRCLFRTFGSFKVSAFLKAEQSGKDILGEAADAGIEFLRRVVEVGTCHVDAVFGTFQLGLQFQEILVGLQLGIVLRDGKQFAEGRSHGTLRLLILGQLFGDRKSVV